MEGLHVTVTEKESIRNIPGIQDKIITKVASVPYNGDDIELETPDAESEIARIKLELLNKVNNTELEQIRLDETTRNTNELKRESQYDDSLVLYTEVSSNEDIRVSSEKTREASETIRVQSMKTIEASETIRVQSMKTIEANAVKLKPELVAYIDANVMTTAEIDTIIANAIK